MRKAKTTAIAEAQISKLQDVQPNQIYIVFTWPEQHKGLSHGVFEVSKSWQMQSDTKSRIPCGVRPLAQFVPLKIHLSYCGHD